MLTSKKTLLTSLLIASFVYCGNAFSAASPYVGASVGLGMLNYGSTTDNIGLGFGIHAGAMLNQYVGLEGFYTDFGSDHGQSITAYGGYGKLNYQFENTLLLIYGKLGLSNLEVGSRSGTGMSYGFGFGYTASNDVDFSVGYQAASGKVDDENYTAGMYGVGIDFKF